MIENGEAKQVDIREKALRGEVVLVSEGGLHILEDQICRAEEEIDRHRQQLGEAVRSDPDLPENTVFKDLKTKLQYDLRRKLIDLRSMQHKAIVYQEDQDGSVKFGTTFEAEMDYGDGDKEVASFTLLGPVEASAKKGVEVDGAEIISYLSPLGQALWRTNPREKAIVTYQVKNAQFGCLIRSIRSHERT